jgi:hypothetical protein
MSVEIPIPNIGEMAGDRRCGGHHGADQMRTAATALTSFKIAVAG